MVIHDDKNMNNHEREIVHIHGEVKVCARSPMMNNHKGEVVHIQEDKKHSNSGFEIFVVAC